ncbi:hypothetical protein SAMN06297251_103303 [Fulvimarina manganoxydans]|uniref:4-amino-4-deoxy-L-arabinose transferase n=1 Tax=Fulvimarina manganoxydans TaxID=937218 RepID=A0A1W2A220_9HYPH|nr:hypothetical protein [Fulvimarina manganoxydans]MEE2951963.1 hypothetical protein [Pseudomonadota bacterium]SMC54725.1 hypothetical protein SAMN06297251_103303 [Fulvimarina manganoxydans]
MTKQSKGWTQSALPFLSVCAAAILFAVALALFQGQDQNYDQGNYHIYDAFAFLNDRANNDVTAAGILTFQNPLVYVPPFLLIDRLSPAVASALIAGVQALNIALAFLIGRILLVAQSASSRRLADLLSVFGAVIAAAAPMFLSEIGTTFADSSTSLLCLLGLLLVLRAGHDRSSANRIAWLLLLLGGLLVGSAAGLKLTNATFAVAIPIAALFGWHRFGDRLKAAILVGVGVGLGYILTGGYWSLKLYLDYGSPVFPFFNEIFKSPDFPLTDIRDARWQIESPLEIITAPFGWAVGEQRSNELYFRDMRFAVAIMVAVVWLVVIAWQRARARPQIALSNASGIGDPSGETDRPGLRIAPDRLVRLIVFCAIAYFLWAKLFYIQRYLVVVELLIGPLTLGLIVAIVTEIGLRARYAAYGIGALTLVVVATARFPDWGHVPFDEDWYAVPDTPPFEEPAALIVFDRDARLAWVATKLPDASTFSRVGNLPIIPGGQFDQAIRRNLNNAPNGRVFVVTVDGRNADRDGGLRAFDLLPASNCREVHLETDILHVCETGPDNRPSWTIAVGDPEFNDMLGEGWTWIDGHFIWSDSPLTKLSIPVPPELRGRPVELLLDLERFQGLLTPEGEPDIRIVVDGGDPQDRNFIEGSPRRLQPVCLPANVTDHADGRVSVDILAKPGKTPRETGYGPDDRTLTVALRSITMKPAKDCPAEDPA